MTTITILVLFVLWVACIVVTGRLFKAGQRSLAIWSGSYSPGLG